MAVTIRLSRLGRKKAPFYRIVVLDERSKRDGRHLELIGTYTTQSNPPTITLKEDRVKYWISVGAKTSDTVTNIINKKMPGFLSEVVEKRTDKIKAVRKARKERLAKTATAAPKKKEAAPKKRAPRKTLAQKRARKKAAPVKKGAR